MALKDDVEAEGEIQWLIEVGKTLLGMSRGHMVGDNSLS
jgi:hypothetical protein